MPLKSFSWPEGLGLLALLLSGCAPGPSPGGAASPLRALVFEYEDKWTSATGAAVVLQQAGIEVTSLNVTNAPDSFSRYDLVFLGGFVSEHPAYTNFMARAASVLGAFVQQGGVLVQMTQADQTEDAPAFLPDPLEAARGDADFSQLYIFHAQHPLLAGLPTRARPDQEVVIPRFLNRPPNWEAFHHQAGFHVLLASTEGPENFALLEAAHGHGRIILSSLFLDKVHQGGSWVTNATLLAISRQFFTNLAHYVRLVRAGRAPDVVPTPPPRRPDPLPWIPGSWTIAVLPDTQNYTVRHPEILTAQTRWIVENKERHNIGYVLHLGDIVGHNTPRQWEHAREAMSLLHGHVPYAIVPGNHDYGTNGNAAVRETRFNEYFPISTYTHWPTFGGAMEPTKMENTFHLFRGGGEDWLVLALEWGPRHKTVAWANDVLARYPDRQAILITHAYLYYDDTRYDWRTRGTNQLWNPHSYGTARDAEGTNDGEELWQQLVRRHRGFALVLNGHVLNDGLGRLTSVGDHSNLVHQVLVNYQVRRQGGEGYLRLVEFLPDGETIQMRTYSPYLDRYLTDSQNQFTLKRRLAPRTF